MLSQLVKFEMILHTVPIMDMLMCWLKVNVENIKDTNNTYLLLLLVPSMYGLEVCYAVLMLEVRSS